MTQHQCGVNIVIILGAFVLLTIVSSWYRRKQLADVFSVIGAWCFIAIFTACFWFTIVWFVTKVVNKIAH